MRARKRTKAPSELEGLRERVALLEQVIDNFPGGLLLYNAKLELVICNAQQKALLGSPDFLFANGPPTLRDLFEYNARRGEYGPGDVDEQVSTRLKLAREGKPHVFERTRPNGAILEVRGTPLAGGGFVTTYFDVTEQRKAQALIAHMAHHDLLTNLPNRALMRDRLEQATARVKRGDKIAVLFVDLDGFKPINDTHGHAMGDVLLKEIAKRLRAATRQTDTVARIGGDEFVVILGGVIAFENVEFVARRILEAIAEPFVHEGQSIRVGASIGISLSPEDGLDPEQLLTKADMAMYAAKKQRKGGYVYAAPNPTGDPVTPDRAFARA